MEFTDYTKRVLITKEVKSNPEGAAQLHSRDRRVSLQDHFRLLAAQCLALRKSGQEK